MGGFFGPFCVEEESNDASNASLWFFMLKCFCKPAHTKKAGLWQTCFVEKPLSAFVEEFYKAQSPLTKQLTPMYYRFVNHKLATLLVIKSTCKMYLKQMLYTQTDKTKNTVSVVCFLRVMSVKHLSSSVKWNYGLFGTLLFFHKNVLLKNLKMFPICHVRDLECCRFLVFCFKKKCSHM